MEKEEIKVFVFYFKRTEKSKYEKGIRIGEQGKIIDLEGNSLESVYDGFCAYEKGCFSITKDNSL